MNFFCRDISFRRIVLYFDGPTDKDTKKILKAEGWHYKGSPKNSWYNYDTEENENTAWMLCDYMKITVNSEDVYISKSESEQYCAARPSKMANMPISFQSAYRIDSSVVVWNLKEAKRYGIGNISSYVFFEKCRFFDDPYTYTINMTICLSDLTDCSGKCTILSLVQNAGSELLKPVNDSFFSRAEEAQTIDLLYVYDGFPLNFRFGNFEESEYKSFSKIIISFGD